MSIREEIEACLETIRTYGAIDIEVDFDDDTADPDDKMYCVSSEYDGGQYCDDLEGVLKTCRGVLSSLAALPKDHVESVRTMADPCDPRFFDCYPGMTSAQIAEFQRFEEWAIEHGKLMDTDAMQEFRRIDVAVAGR